VIPLARSRLPYSRRRKLGRATPARGLSGSDTGVSGYPFVAMANVWFKSRLAAIAAREQSVWVQPVDRGYADIIRKGRRFRFSHETITRDETGAATTWLVFEDAGPTV
jgi:hypothetical protein